MFRNFWTFLTLERRNLTVITETPAPRAISYGSSLRLQVPAANLVHARLSFLGSLMNSTELRWPTVGCLQIVLQRLPTSLDAKLMAQT
jgi:hypothetical protein